MPAQLANESFRADHVRFGNSVGAIVQVLMRSDVPTAEAFFRDHLGSEALWYEAAILGVAYSLIRGTYREIRIEKIGKPNAVSLGRESQQAAVGIERIASSSFQKLEAAFLTTIDEAFANSAVHPKHKVQGVRAEARDLHDLGDPAGVEAAQSGSRLDVFKGQH